jgi:hypothetical protein
MTEEEKKNRQNEEVFCAVKMPAALARQMDELVALDDTDRSKLLRRLIREEAARRGVVIVAATSKPSKKAGV